MPCDTARLVSRSGPAVARWPSYNSVTAKADSTGLRVGVDKRGGEAEGEESQQVGME